jgi:hypothetical protein
MDKTFSIAEFCADEGLSLSFFYKLDRLGNGMVTSACIRFSGS